MIRQTYQAVVRPVVRAVTPSWAWRRYGDALWWWHVARPGDARQSRTIGWPAVATLRLAGSRAAGRTAVRRLRLAGFPHPVYYRPGSSDADVVRQVFGDREYRCVLGRTDVRYIVDCGGNIGLTTMYLLHHYPDAEAVVVEPDAGNLRVCRQNLRPFAGRVRFVQSGVWPASVPLVVERGCFADGREWAFQVRPAAAGERPDLTAHTVEDLLAAGGFPRADILKMDIEAAEAEVFAGPTGWLDRVRTLVIELHGPECERVVERAAAGRLRRVGMCGELTVYERPDSTGATP